MNKAEFTGPNGQPILINTDDDVTGGQPVAIEQMVDEGQAQSLIRLGCGVNVLVSGTAAAAWDVIEGNDGP